MSWKNWFRWMWCRISHFYMSNDKICKKMIGIEAFYNEKGFKFAAESVKDGTVIYSVYYIGSNIRWSGNKLDSKTYILLFFAGGGKIN